MRKLNEKKEMLMIVLIVIFVFCATSALFIFDIKTYYNDKYRKATALCEIKASEIEELKLKNKELIENNSGLRKTNANLNDYIIRLKKDNNELVTVIEIMSTARDKVLLEGQNND